MTGNLSQIIALTTYGNDFFRNGNIPFHFESEHTVFQFCNKVDFRESDKLFFFSKLRENVIADHPVAWFEYLKQSGCKELRLYFEYSKTQNLAKDHKLAGMVGGGGNWLIEAIYADYSNYWANRWQVTDRNAIDQKIWSVNYIRTGVKQRISNLQMDHGKVKHMLGQILTEISDFAFKQHLKNWAEQFDKAKMILESTQPEENFYFKNLIPIDNYSLEARQILFAAAASWVFGGMGSWNDLIFDHKQDNKTYDRLSEELYSCINGAVIAAANSY
jgi:hypothetical protein